MKSNIAIIGAGITGLTVGNLLKDTHNVTIFEKESVPGGLIRCKEIDGGLFHICGGHVFNSKRNDVLDWFWSHFSKDDFLKADRNSVIYLGDKILPYPIENYIYLLSEEQQKEIIADWLGIKHSNHTNANFEDFLINRFGKTLYDLYFKPYNEKIWNSRLDNVSLDWLEGKLPMPTVEEMFLNNINKIKEKTFVHSTFWYEKHGGSQFIADTLSKGLNIIYNTPVEELSINEDGTWSINGNKFDSVVYCANIKELCSMMKSDILAKYTDFIKSLRFHGTTTVFCKIDKNPYSWVYLPDTNYSAHRIICTGNFSPFNNPTNAFTATIEFTDHIDIDQIKKQLVKIPLNPKYITHNYNKYTYPIQDSKTRLTLNSIKELLSNRNFHLCGRFAEWEYYNMDAAIGSAIDLCKRQFVN